MNLAETMRRASQAYASGDFSTALNQAEIARRAQPRNTAVLQFIGIANCQSGDPARGLVYFQAALKLAPGDADLRFNAARAALDAGDTATAKALLQPIAATPVGQRLAAEIAKADLGSEDALEQYRALAMANPRDFEVLTNYGNALNQAARPSEAVPVLEQAMLLAPTNPQVLLNLGRALVASGRHEDARSCFLKAAHQPDAGPDVRFELGASLLRHGQHEDALAQFSEAARLGMKTAQVFVSIGVCFMALEQREQSEQAFRMALRVEPASARAHLNLAMVFERENRVDDLRALAASAREIVAEGPDRDFIEALILRRDNHFEDALAIARRSASDSIDPTVRSQFIGQVADRLGQYDEAFVAFEAMNHDAMYSPDAASFEGSAYPRQTEANTAMITPAWFAGWNPAKIGDARPSPAFLGGFLRSGTTLLDTILMGHPATIVREEEPMLTRLEDAAGSIAALPAMSTADVTRMRDAYYTEALARGPLDPGKLLIDKYPLAPLRATYIQRAFPDAKFIFALRHPCDVVLSCWMQNFRITSAMAAFLTLENAARMYAATMEHWMRCREVMPLAVHTVRYEDMVEDLEGQLRPLLGFLELEWDDALLAFQKTARDRGYIRTPSYAQVTEGLYSRSSGRWERYRNQMQPVLDTLAPWAIRFGYDDPRS